MPRRRLGRFLLEVAFLAGVAAAVTVARLHAPAVIATMAVAWILVALLEWTAWRDVPHYGRGLPPRYYVPQVALPPPRAVAQRRPYAYPAHAVADEEATWIAPAGDWGETFVDWPVLGSATSEQTAIIDPDIADEEPSTTQPGEPTVAGQPAIDLDELDGIAEEDEETDEANLVGPPGTVRPPNEAARPPLAPVAEYVPVELRMPERVEAAALYHVDPLGTPARKRWFGRAEEEPAIEVHDGPPPGRRLPGPARTGS
jgi:hypothetical protein